MNRWDEILAERAAGERTTSALPPTNGVSGPPRASIHPYAEAVRQAWLTRLDNLQRPWAQGAAWDTNCFVTARKLIELANSPWAGYRLTDARTDYHAHAPHDAKWDKREKCWNQAHALAGAGQLPEPAQDAPVPTVTTLDPVPAVTVVEVDTDAEADFWNARPLLTHLHTYARARRVSPWAVLGVALARVSVATYPHVVLPAIVGGHASLNIFVGLVGPSGAGKGAAERVGEQAHDVGHIEVHTTGSGEGIAHSYMRRIRGGEIEQHNVAVLFSVPEIDTLTALTGRLGATLMPELRRAWSGESLGFAYADPAKRLPVPAHKYRLCLIAGIQPARAGALLDDTDGGTPQRFLWLPATDPDAPNTPPDCPEPMPWQKPSWNRFVDRSGHAAMSVCDTAKATIDQARVGRLRGDHDALDGHGLLARLKVAATLALADGRLDINDEDWHLGGVVMQRSDATRTSVLATLRSKVTQSNNARAEAEASRAVIVDETVTEAGVKRAARNLHRRLSGEGDWLAESKVGQLLAYRDRGHLGAALDRLVSDGLAQIQVRQGGVNYYRIEGQ